MLEMESYQVRILLPVIADQLPLRRALLIGEKNNNQNHKK